VPQSDYPGVQTQVVDHTGEVPTSTQTFTGVDKAALATRNPGTDGMFPELSVSNDESA
jgi:hypothetical protein